MALRIGAIVAIVAGIALRLQLSLSNPLLDRDEVLKLLRVAGSTNDQFIEQVYTGQPIQNSTLQETYQRPCQDCSPFEGLSSLAANKEHPPLYYVNLQIWLKTLGSSLNPKFFSALISAVTVVPFYALARHLSGRPGPALLATLFWAWSPYHLAMAQHTSQYALTGLLVCLSDLYFCRLVQARQARWQPLIGYGITIALGLYTHLFFLFNVLAQGIALLWLERGHLTRRFWRTAIAASGGIACFTPWLLSLFLRRDKFLETTGLNDAPELSQMLPPLGPIAGATVLLQTFFKNRNLSLLSNDFIHNNGLVIASLLGLVALSYWLLKRGKAVPKITKILTLSKFCTFFLPLAAGVLFFGHPFGLKVRYFLPAQLLLMIAVALWLATLLDDLKPRLYPHISSSSSPSGESVTGVQLPWKGIFGIVLTMVLLLLSVGSTGRLWRISTQGFAVGNQLGEGIDRVAKSVNLTTAPIVFTSEEHIKVLMLSNLLRADAQWRAFRQWDDLRGAVKSELERPCDRACPAVFVFQQSITVWPQLTAIAPNLKTYPEKWRGPLLYELRGET